MPGTVVTAEGNFDHHYQFTAREGRHIVDSSVRCTVVEQNYVGEIPLVCQILPPICTFRNGDKEMDVLLKYLCDPPSACPDFKIAIDWEEADDLRQLE